MIIMPIDAECSHIIICVLDIGKETLQFSITKEDRNQMSFCDVDAGIQSRC